MSKSVGYGKAGLKEWGLGDKSFNFEAVVALEMYFFGFTEFDLREEFLVDVG